MNIKDLDQYLLNKNVIATLFVIMFGESSIDHHEAYSALFGWKPGNSRVFTSFADHPRERTYEKYDGQFIRNGKIDYTTAAGAFQITETTWNGLVRRWKFEDFSPLNQRRAAVALIIGRGAMAHVLAGRIREAIALLPDEWVSLPGGAAGDQPSKKMADALAIYARFGGSIEGEVPATPENQSLDSTSEPAAGADQAKEPTSYYPAGEADMTPIVPIIAAGAKSAFVGAAIDAIFDAAPKLLDLFKGTSENAKRNVEATKVLLSIGKAATGGQNEQAIVERLVADPAAQEAVRAAVERSWFEVTAVAEASLVASRKFIQEYSQMKDVRLVAFNMTFIELLSIFFVVIGMGAALIMVASGTFGETINTMVITLVLVESVVGVRKAWIGNTPSYPQDRGTK